jgi:N-acyl-D-aspartate/D-glutamate deacylase
VFPSLTPSYGVSDEGWAIRREVWSDPRVVLGGSDAGAHVDLMCHANYPTVVLGELVRERGIFTLEDGVRRITDVPAQLLGLRGRGRVATGYQADLFVFDPDTVATAPTTARRDLPGGAERLGADAIGVEHVFVAGTATVRGSRLTGALPGTALRSGLDTDTVTVPGSR